MKRNGWTVEVATSEEASSSDSDSKDRTNGRPQSVYQITHDRFSELDDG